MSENIGNIVLAYLVVGAIYAVGLFVVFAIRERSECRSYWRQAVQQQRVASLLFTCIGVGIQAAFIWPALIANDLKPVVSLTLPAEMDREARERFLTVSFRGRFWVSTLKLGPWEWVFWLRKDASNEDAK